MNILFADIANGSQREVEATSTRRQIPSLPNGSAAPECTRAGTRHEGWIHTYLYSKGLLKRGGRRPVRRTLPRGRQAIPYQNSDTAGRWAAAALQSIESKDPLHRHRCVESAEEWMRIVLGAPSEPWIRVLGRENLRLRPSKFSSLARRVAYVCSSRGSMDEMLLLMWTQWLCGGRVGLQRLDATRASRQSPGPAREAEEVTSNMFTHSLVVYRPSDNNGCRRG